VTFHLLDDTDFLNCNFSALRDPALGPGSSVDESDLYELVTQARSGDRTAAMEYIDTMNSTLCLPAFESFQRIFGPRAIEYRDWFYSKLFQFVSILLHDTIEVRAREGTWGQPKTDRPWEEGQLQGSGPEIYPDDLEAAFDLEHDTSYDWRELAWLAAVEMADASTGERHRKLQSLVDDLAHRTAHKKSVAMTTRPILEWPDNAKRDQIILAGLRARQPRIKICEILDAHLIPTTPEMRKHGLSTWVAAWNDPEFRPNVHSLFSHVWSRKGVKH
jgi:hypothetical protein